MPDQSSDVAIRLDAVSKRFPGQAQPAVRELSLDIASGEIVILIGPSGCGKTTTLRMINRLEEPSSGRIFLSGQDVTTADPDQLRRHIGYVIQQIGLFPHMTIAENIGLIPKVLGWNSRTVRGRVDELLDLVGLDPAAYRQRYPKELSGGQQQRIGVARALSADPPVMLMDEPFGAIDPITRERLQDEFLRLQQQIRKTIVFVTHDIREAMTLGTRIALLDVGGVLAQYDTPERLLSAPKNEFVSDFLGSGKEVRRLDLTSVGDIELEPVRIVTAAADTAGAPDEVRVIVIDESGRPKRWLHDTHRVAAKGRHAPR